MTSALACWLLWLLVRPGPAAQPRRPEILRLATATAIYGGGGNFLRLATAYELYGGGSGAYLQVQLCITDLHYFHCINLTNDRFSIRVAHRLLVGPMVIVCTVLWPSVMLYAVTFSASLC